MKNFVITIVISIIGISGFAIFNPFSLFDYPKKDVRTEYVQKNVDKPALVLDSSVNVQTQTFHQPRSSSNVQVTRLINTLGSMSFDSYKSQHVEDQVHLLPESISWSQFNSILNHFDHDSYRVDVVETLRNRITANCSESEFGKFLNHFDFDSYKTDARRLLNK